MEEYRVRAIVNFLQIEVQQKEQYRVYRKVEDSIQDLIRDPVSKTVEGFQSEIYEVKKDHENQFKTLRSLRSQVLNNRFLLQKVFSDLYICKSDIPQEIMELDMKRLNNLFLSDIEKEEFEELSTRYKLLFPPQRPSKDFSEFTEAEIELWGRLMATPEQDIASSSL
jgi:hypothetical protein